MSDPQEGVKEEVREGQAAAYKRHYTSTVLPAVVKTMQSWSHNVSMSSYHSDASLTISAM